MTIKAADLVSAIKQNNALEAWLFESGTEKRIFKGPRVQAVMFALERFSDEETASKLEGTLSHINPQTGAVHWGPCALSPLQCEKLLALSEDQAVNRGAVIRSGIETPIKVLKAEDIALDVALAEKQAVVEREESLLGIGPISIKPISDEPIDKEPLFFIDLDE